MGANVTVSTDALENSASYIKNICDNNKDLCNNIKNVNSDKCVSLNNFKKSLCTKYNIFEEHSDIINTKLNECAENLIEIDSLIGSHVNVPLDGVDNYNFLEFDSVVALSENSSFSLDQLSSKNFSNLNISAGTHLLEYTLSDGNTVRYVVRVPEGATENMPAIFWLHGVGELAQAERIEGMGVVKAANDLGENRFIIIQPSTNYLFSNSGNQEIDKIDKFIDEIANVYKFDKDRVILTGHSMGGGGTWYLGNKCPEKFAAIAPVSCGTGDLGFEINLDNLENSNIPIYVATGGNENGTYNNNQAVLDKCKEINPNRDVSIRSIMGANHGLMNYAGYTQEFFDWCFKQKRKNNA